MFSSIWYGHSSTPSEKAIFGVSYWYVLFSFLFVWINYFNPLLLIDLYQPGKWVAMYMCAGWSIVPLFQQCSLFDFGTDPTMRVFFVFHSILYCDFLYVWIVGYCTVYKYLFYTCIVRLILAPLSISNTCMYVLNTCFVFNHLSKFLYYLWTTIDGTWK